MELGPIGVQATNELVYMRMEPRGYGEDLSKFRAERQVTKAQQQQLFERDQELHKKFGGRVHCDSVIELPDDLKSTIALPAITRRIVNELVEHPIDGWGLERMRAHKILDFDQWSVQLV